MGNRLPFSSHENEKVNREDDTDQFPSRTSLETKPTECACSLEASKKPAKRIGKNIDTALNGGYIEGTIGKTELNDEEYRNINQNETESEGENSNEERSFPFQSRYAISKNNPRTPDMDLDIKIRNDNGEIMEFSDGRFQSLDEEPSSEMINNQNAKEKNKGGSIDLKTLQEMENAHSVVPFPIPTTFSIMENNKNPTSSYEYDDSYYRKNSLESVLGNFHEFKQREKGHKKLRNRLRGLRQMRSKDQPLSNDSLEKSTTSSISKKSTKTSDGILPLLKKTMRAVSEKKIYKRIIMVGLDGSGKTSLLLRMAKEQKGCLHIDSGSCNINNKIEKETVEEIESVVNSAPTIGFNCEEIKYKRITFVIWDLGGENRLRNLWKFYLIGCDGIIFVVDSSDPNRIREAKREFKNLLSLDTLQETPFLFLANKVDLPQHISNEEIIAGMKITNRIGHNRKWNIIQSSTFSGDGLVSALDWFYKVFDETYRKTRQINQQNRINVYQKLIQKFRTARPRKHTAKDNISDISADNSPNSNKISKCKENYSNKVDSRNAILEEKNMQLGALSLDSIDSISQDGISGTSLSNDSTSVHHRGVESVFTVNNAIETEIDVTKENIHNTTFYQDTDQRGIKLALVLKEQENISIDPLTSSNSTTISKKNSEEEKDANIESLIQSSDCDILSGVEKRSSKPEIMKGDISNTSSEKSQSVPTELVNSSSWLSKFGFQ